MADLKMLITDTPQGPYPYAGMPWYSTTFGRDGLITALQMLWIDPRVARGVLRRLAPNQATHDRPAGRRRAGQDPARDRATAKWPSLREVPFGRVLRQRRCHAALRVAGRPLFRAHRRIETRSRLWPNIEAALALDRRRSAIAMATGLSNTPRETRAGARQPGLEGLLRRDLPCRRPACRRADRAVRGAGLCLRRQGTAARCACARQARPGCKLQAEERCAPTFRGGILVRGLGTYALALDGASSRAGCALPMPGMPVHRHRCARPRRAWSRRPDAVAIFLRLGHPYDGARRSALQSDVLPQRLDLAARQCADRAGVRALRPQAAVEQCSTVCSMPRSQMDLRRLPELFCGFRRPQRGPTLYPVACAPQAWASAAPFALLEAAFCSMLDASVRDPSANPSPAAFLYEVAL